MFLFLLVAFLGTGYSPEVSFILVLEQCIITNLNLGLNLHPGFGLTSAKFVGMYPQ
jgi:hypothetical protein